MQRLRIGLVILLGALSFAADGQAFPCDGRLIISLYPGAPPNATYWIDLQPDGTVSFESLADYPSAAFNAIGYNRRDNYIYGVQTGTNHVVRLKADGAFELVGEVSLVNAVYTGSGDCTPDGQYVYRENQVNQLLFFEVLNGFELVGQLDLYWDPASGNSGPFTARLDDFAFDPTEPDIIYAYQRNYPGFLNGPEATHGHLLRINADLDGPTAGRVSPVGYLSEEVVRHLGALFFSSEGELYGYGSLEGIPYLEQNRFVAIDKTTGEATLLGVGPGASRNDGCSCPYNLVFQKKVTPQRVTCHADTLTFELTLSNRYNATLSGLILRDTLPAGLVITELGGNFSGSLQPGAGPGTRFVGISNLEVPEGEVVRITVTAAVNDLSPGHYTNQAFLHQLPARFGEEQASDDPATPAIFHDPTPFTVIPRTLPAMELSVGAPTDCLEPNDGRITIGTPLITAGAPYEVTFRDSSGTTFTERVFSEAGVLTLDSLSPDIYTLLSVSAANEGCAFSLNDTTVQIDPPHALLNAAAENNGPVCAGETVVLTGRALNGSTVRWSGPGGYASELPAPVIPAATVAASGIYVFTATLGACEQEVATPVRVQPAIDPTITGDLSYCEGDTIALQAAGAAPPEHMRWYGPGGGFLHSGPTLSLDDAGQADNGDYRVVMDNAACRDSARVTVGVFATPRIFLPPIRESNFCDPIVLRPVIRRGRELTFRWRPATALSCDDCREPTLTPPFPPAYHLTVVNGGTCADSAEITIRFEPEKELYVPNAFSPNGDQHNDHFRVYAGCAISRIQRLEVFNRWGAPVFSAGPYAPADESVFWDGRQGNEPAPAGVYTWLVEAVRLDGSVQRFRGDVALLR